MAAHPVADGAVALVPPAIQGVNGDAQHFRDIRKRHQLVTRLECHDHLPFRGSHTWGKSLGRRASGLPGPLDRSRTDDRQRPKSRSDSGRSQSNNKNRTRMASLEGIRAPTRADLDAPVGLTCLSARHRHWLWLRARKGPGAQLLFDLLRAVATSSSGGTSDGRRSLAGGPRLQERPVGATTVALNRRETPCLQSGGAGVAERHPCLASRK
jgi:hypothetical protein